MFTLQILANNQIRFRHTLGLKPKRNTDVFKVSPYIDLSGKPSPLASRFSDSHCSPFLNSDPSPVQLELDFSGDRHFAPGYSSPPGAPAPPAAPLTTLENIDTHQKSTFRVWGKPTKFKAFTSYARDSVQEACCTLDRIYRRDQLRFLTLTLPGSSWESLDLLSRWSGWFVDRLLVVLRNWKKYNPEAHSIFVWELQKRGALHIHWLIGCSQDIDTLALRLKDKWFNLLLELGKKENIDMFARKGFGSSHIDNPDNWQWKIESIRKSVGRYMSKYCSKDFNKKFPQRLKKYCPSRWWSCSRNLLNEVRKLRLTLRFEGLSTDDLDSFLDIVYTLFPSDSVTFNYYRPWLISDTNISGVTRGVFFDSSVFSEVLSKILPYISEFYQSVRSQSIARASKIAHNLYQFSPNFLTQSDLLRLADSEIDSTFDHSDILIDHYSLETAFDRSLALNPLPITRSNSPYYCQQILTKSIDQFGF